MKKVEIKLVEKARTKIVRLAIEESLLQVIKENLKQLGYEPKLVKKQVLKATKLISKKLTEELDLEREAEHISKPVPEEEDAAD